jgi:succinate dehydrogenase / fumarate reductase cytochrome b subunit
MSTRASFLSSSIGTKILIAVTGLSLFLFLVAHLIGNTLIFVGPEAFNGYSHKLISNPLIYVAEAGLLALFGLHVYKAVTNWFANRGARPQAYELKRNAGHTSRKSLASTTMIVTGLVTLVFVVLHLVTFKYGPGEAQGYLAPSDHGPVRDLHRLTIEVFQNPAYVIGYVACMLLIFLHLRHGLSSALQSLGVNHPRYNTLVVRAGIALAILIGGGFAAIPVAVYFGF